MASLVRRSSVLSCQVIRKCVTRNLSKALQRTSKHKLTVPTISGVNTRNIWHLSRNSHVITSHTVSKNCSCCKLHTEGDIEFSKFLESEIKAEKENKPSGVKKIEGWEVKTDGAEVTLTRKKDNETIQVFFNVNQSVDEDAHDQAPEDDKVNMVSKPDFTVEITKSSGKTLSLQCSFSHDMVDEEEGRNDDLFGIHEVALIKDGKWEDNTFSISSNTMDGTLYDMLMDMLHDRGIGDEFAGKLIEFSTNYEQGKYIEFLGSMKSFLEEK